MIKPVPEAPGSDSVIVAVEQFLYLEARLQDEHRYPEWEALWVTGEARYWVPMSDDGDPKTQISYINDNRERLASRIRQLSTGRRHAQTPKSRTRRLISNIEVERNGSELHVSSNFILVESRRGSTNLWGGRTLHRLIDQSSELRIREKTVLLVNNEDSIPNLAFLI
jgi:benzoate/toluate 1,2-dioxygenase subunit beta